MDFELKSKFKPAGDQPEAIKELISSLAKNKHQILLGATGTGKTFTIANVIEKTKKTTLVLSHNKTLAAQLYSELKGMFPNNRVEYFVSNFDYYRPEAYLPSSDTYVDKTSKSNWDLEAMRMSTINALSTRKDTIVVASVAAIYGLLNPSEYRSTFLELDVGMTLVRKDFFHELVKRNYLRNNIELKPSTFRSRGDVIEISPGWTQDFFIRIDLFGSTVEGIAEIDTLSGEVLKKHQGFTIFPGDAYTTRPGSIERALSGIQTELVTSLKDFNKKGQLLEAQRIEQRTKGDLESLREFGICPGIENYSRHLDGRAEGQRPYVLFDYMPKDTLLIIDESHMMMPQINAMYNGDRARKENLVNYGFRLPSALDNRPLRFSEFEKFDYPRIYVSATPSEYELNQTDGEVVSQIIRPTGLLDPVISVVKTEGQVEDIYDRIQEQKKIKERTFILTVTKRMSEELARHLQEKGEKIAYLHSEHKTFEREEILRKLRKGVYDTVIGVNLVREGIDLPEVSLILVLDADKESFFRSTRSLVQIIGRAARNVNGRVILYGDKMTKSMKAAMDETSRRRDIQHAHNLKHNITPKTIIKPISNPIHGNGVEDAVLDFLGSKDKKQKTKDKKSLLASLRGQMLQASRDMDFERAIKLRDVILELEA